MFRRGHPEPWNNRFLHENFTSTFVFARKLANRKVWSGLRERKFSRLLFRVMLIGEIVSFSCWELRKFLESAAPPGVGWLFFLR